MRWFLALGLVPYGCGSDDGGFQSSDGGADGEGDGGGPDDGGIQYDFPDYPDGGGGGGCYPGTYVGEFEGTVAVTLIVPMELDTSGTVMLTLEKMGAGEFYEISGGVVMGEASGNPYSAEVQGRLNCATMQLENGQLTNGMVTVSDITYGFEGEPGTLTADYGDPDGDGNPGFYDGTWAIEQTSGPPVMGTGSGTWWADYTP